MVMRRLSRLPVLPLSLVVGVFLTPSILQACARSDSKQVVGQSSIAAPGDTTSSQPVSGTLLPPVTTAQRTYHIGNSLTDTLNDVLEPLAKRAGFNHEYLRSTIPGAPTDWNWDHPGEAMGESDYREIFNTKAPIDHLFIQPFAGHGRTIENETDYAGRFYRLARQKSPNVQLWLYAQWASRRFDDDWAQAKESAAGLGLTPAKTWEEAAYNHLKYHEAVRQRLSEQNPGKPVLIVPAGIALARLKQAIDSGKVPGMRDFFAENLEDDIHLNAKGAYLVALVHFACIYRKDPTGLMIENTGLTAEQAAIYQKIAWETVKGYRWAGERR